MGATGLGAADLQADRLWNMSQNGPAGPAAAGDLADKGERCPFPGGLPGKFRSHVPGGLRHRSHI